MIDPCDVCGAGGVAVTKHGQVLCAACTEMAIEWEPSFVRFRARQAARRGDDYGDCVLSNIAGWLEVHAGYPVPAELPGA